MDLIKYKRRYRSKTKYPSYPQPPSQSKVVNFCAIEDCLRNASYQLPDFKKFLCKKHINLWRNRTYDNYRLPLEEVFAI